MEILELISLLLCAIIQLQALINDSHCDLQFALTCTVVDAIKFKLLREIGIYFITEEDFAQLGRKSNSQSHTKNHHERAEESNETKPL